MRKLECRKAAWGLALILLLGGVGPAAAELVFYTDRPTFNAANPGLPVEDFEEARVPPIGVIGFDGPLNSMTNNLVFQPGEILPGVSIVDRPMAPGDTGLAATAPPFGGTTSKAIFANTFADTLDIVFTGGTTFAAGMNLLSLLAASTVDISIFDANGLLLGTMAANATPAGANFFGVSSTDAIGRINVSSRTIQAEGIDNLAFGAGGDPFIPEPATITLTCVGAACLLGYGWRRKKVA